ncbi:hypothetical protein AUP74_00514 [Microbulbifer aggregans]|uniref:SnoaL-like domain-containing protein n=1 Tax=Microbulbifer aggregans TaxID=1769779 RepID=A0A1C9W4B8_9GAMM|nr:nuclear transport factor 2 family protein [Microbulbifer aggregans]AOS95984.1 hypothetical protein AUP74_00514 [Microbulbifer aggregans]
MEAERKRQIEALCRCYLTSLESGDLPTLLSLFTEDATATSPISGKQPVPDFYSYVMQVTSNRSMPLKTIFVGASNPYQAAVHMVYTRTVKEGQPSTIECVDIFDLNEECTKFTGIRIIYDTAPVRSEFDLHK